MFRFLTVVALALLALLPSAVVAQAAGLKPLQRGPEVLTDGSRYALIGAGESGVQVRDDTTGGVIAAPAPPGECRSPQHGIGGSTLWWICNYVPANASETGVRYVAEPRLYDLREQKFHEMRPEALRRFRALTAATPDCDGITFVEFGARWLYGVGSAPFHCSAAVFFDWQRGRETDENPGDARHVEDLDREDLRRRLCSPLRRLGPYRHVGKFGLTKLGAGVSRRQLVLERCGSGKRQVLARGRAVPGDEQEGQSRWVLGPTVAAWLAGNRLHVFYLQSRRKRTFGLGGPSSAMTLSLTRTRLYVSRRRAEAGPRWSLRLP